MSYFKSSKLKDVIKKQIDNRGKNPPSYSDYSKHPIIDNYLIKNTKYPNLNEVNRYLNEELFETFLRGYLKKGDVLVTLVGAGIGNVTTANNDNVVIIQNTIGLRTNNLMKNEYLYYLLLFKYPEIIKYDRGSSQPSIRKTDLFNMKIQYPEIKDQEAIVKILSSFDNKIELNNKISRELEELSQSLYKHWFVDYEFPNENGDPFKSNNGEMIEIDSISIPKGWEIIELNDHLNFLRGIEPGSKNYQDEKSKNNIPFYRVGDMIDKTNIKYIQENLAKDKLFNEKDVLVSFDGAIGRVMTGENGSYSTGMRKVFSKNNIFSNEFIYVLFQTPNIQNTINQFANGTTILHAGSSIKHLKTVYKKDIVEKFTELITPIVTKIISIKKENTELNEMRDLLLPKLMSGEIRIPLEED